MRKIENRSRNSSEDENAQSRMQLKNRLNFVSDQFSISRLTESLSDNQRIHNMFPQINEPTLEFKDTEQSNHLKSEDDLELEHYQTQGLTARLSYQERSNTSNLLLLEERVESLEREVDQKNSQLLLSKKKNDSLQKQLDRTKKELQRKNELIQNQEKELSSLKLKQSTSDYESRNCHSNSKSLLEQSIENFCPELLSPEETVQLLSQLLKKASRSSKMMKSLASDNTTKQILSKIQKS